MDVETEDIDSMRETVANSDMHAMHHLFSVDERGDMWGAIENLQDQIDSLYKELIAIRTGRMEDER